MIPEGLLNKRLRMVVASQCLLAEGPLWDDTNSTLMWTDIESKNLHSYSPTDKTHTVTALRDRLGSFSIIDGNTMLAAFEKKIAIFNYRENKIIESRDIETDVDGTRMNDGRTDRSGNFIVSGYDTLEQGRTFLYHISSNLRITRWRGGISSGNSTCFSPDGSIMYFSDAEQGIIWKYDYDPDEPSIRNEQIFYDFSNEPGLPDGSVVDSSGCLWNAEWGGSRIVRITPEGKIDRVVEMPVPIPTCAAFGGPDLKTLFITSARKSLDEKALEKYPESGNIFAYDLDVAGLSDARFQYTS